MKHQTKTITATLADHQWIEPATLATATLLCTIRILRPTICTKNENNAVLSR